jgi:hypothetical protein
LQEGRGEAGLAGASRLEGGEMMEVVGASALEGKRQPEPSRLQGLRHRMTGGGHGRARGCSRYDVLKCGRIAARQTTPRN